MDLNRLWQGQRTSPMRNTESMHHCQILYYAGWSPPHNWRKFNTDESKSCPAPPRGTTGPPPPTLRVAEPGARVSSEDRLPTSADQRAPSTTKLSTGDPVRRTSHTETTKGGDPAKVDKDGATDSDQGSSSSRSSDHVLGARSAPTPHMRSLTLRRTFSRSEPRYLW